MTNKQPHTPGFRAAVAMTCGLALLFSSACGIGATELQIGERHQVTSALGGYHPRWSPDSQQIAYVGGNWPDIAVYLIPAAGGDHTPVPLDRSGDLALSWHPNGDELAFDGYVTDGGRLDIYNVTISTGVVSRRTTVGGFGPHWRADGQRIAFGSYRNGNGDIYSVAADGSGLQRHTTSAAMDYYPQWSPDGSRLAYASENSGNTDVWITDVATSQATRFTTDPAQDDRVVWSPDGQWLAWDSLRGGVRHIYARSVAGGEPICLTADHEEAGMADWAPDGSAICYVSGGHVWVAEIGIVTPNERTSFGSLRAMYSK
jgi:Tol biopolymer transport system component